MQVKQQRVKYWDDYIHWYLNGKMHRDLDLPSNYYFNDGELDAISYVQHSKSHRTIGPAYIDYKRKIKSYYYQNRRYGSLDEIKMLEACR